MRTALIAVAALAAGGLPAASHEPPDPGGEKKGAWAEPVLVAKTVASVYDISPDGKRFLLSDRRSHGVFDREAGKLVWQVDNSTVHDAKFSPDGKTVAAGEWQNGVNFYDAATGKKLYTIPAGEERPWQVHYRPDGTLLYHTSSTSFAPAPPWTQKYSIVHYDPVKRKELGKVSDSVTYSGTNPWLGHRGAGFIMEHHQIEGTARTTRRTVNYTDPLTGKKTPTIDLDVNDVPLELSPDGKTLVAVTLGQQPRLVDTATGKTLKTLGGHKRLVTSAAYSPDGRLVATVTGTRSNIATRGAADFGTTTYRGPAEFAVWDAATGRLVSRSEFPTSELDFVDVRFSPDSKFAVAETRLGPAGKGRATYAFGAVPFDKSGGAVLSFPRDEELKPKPAAVATRPGVVGDPLDRLLDELAKPDRPAAAKVDALFLASLGRFATASEQKRVKEKYGDKLTADAWRKLLAEVAAMPEFDAHLKSLQLRQPAAPPAFPSSPLWPGSPLQPYPSWPNPAFPTPVKPAEKP